MITAKERSKLNGIGMTLQVSVHVGKNGITDAVVNEIASILDNKEIVKIALLKNSDLDTLSVSTELEEKLACDTVSRVGNRIVVYRFSSKDDVKHVL